MPLILASSSSYRRALLERLRLPFTVQAPAIDETVRPGESPAPLVTRLAREKALRVARDNPGAFIIGSDQVASLARETLGKPGGFEAASRQLALCSGKKVQFFTAVCLIAADGEILEAMETTRVVFRVLKDREIAAYLHLEEPYDCAGSFKCEGLGSTLFEAIEGRDPTALEGLPLIALSRLLRGAGLDPLR